MKLITALYVTHLISGSGLNEGTFNHNQLIGIQYESYVVATMKNSYYNRSYIVAKDSYYKGKFVDYGYYVGVASGYQDLPYAIGEYQVFAAPYIQKDRYKVMLFGDALVVSMEFSW